MKLRFKKLLETAVTPSYAKVGDAGLDLTATSRKIVDGPEVTYYHYVEYGTGIAVEIPEGYVGLIFPRSSISKKELFLANSVAVIDPGYRGEIKLRFKVVGGEPTLYEDTADNYYYAVGERIGQLMVIPFPSIELEEVQELSETERADTGFGSSNEKLK